MERERRRARLQQRLACLLVGQELDPSRFQQEVAVLADKSDIHEELARLDCHFEQLESILASGLNGKAIGRRLDFLLQELSREANTIASKSQLADVDIALESTQFAKNNILVQSAASMLAQANNLSGVALQLLT